VDPRSVTLRVDGRDVTRNARIDGNEINYTDDLGRGRHTAELSVRDRAGNTARKVWSFEVIHPRDNAAVPVQPIQPPAAVPYPGGFPVMLTSHANGSVVDLINQPLVLRGRTAPNANVVVQVEVNGSSPNAQRTELPDRNVQADGNGNFSVVIDAAGQRGFPMMNYLVRVRAVVGSQITDQAITLQQRG
jgi:hypothetical protein